MAEVKVERKSREELESLGVFDWPIWEKEVSAFDWHYDSTEQCYIIEGHVRVEPEDGKPVEITPGDFVTFPAGMDCFWKISTPVKKHYKFG